MLNRLCGQRNLYADLQLTMPEVDLTAMPAVMEDAMDEAAEARDETVFPRRKDGGCPLLQATA